MENKQTPKELRKRKALLILPLLVMPFLTMAFWALGGGKNEEASGREQKKGLNLELPGAQLKEDKDQNKLRFYEAAQRDSARWKNLLKNDPFYPLQFVPDTHLLPGPSKEAFAFDPAPLKTRDYKDPNEEKVYQKLAELNQGLNRVSAPSSKPKEDQSSLITSKGNVPTLEEMDRLEGMMKSLQRADDPDPELDQLNSMMEKILDIQHPERVKERSKEITPTHKRSAVAIRRERVPASIGLIDTTEQKTSRGVLPGFFGLEEEKLQEQNAIQAVVHENQTLISGTVLKLRLLDALYLDGSIIPKGSLVFGTTSLNGERLHVEITSVRSDNLIFPVRLDVYDLDGLRGIYIPGSITREVAKGSADNSLQMLEMTSLDPSLKAQMATAGVNAAKNLLGKKAKLVKVMVKAGYKVLLKDQSAL